MRPTIAYINTACIRRNVEKIKEMLGSTPLMVMVKADGYGHGILPAAHAALDGGADELGVAIPEEGEELRRDGITAPILSVGALLNEDDARTVVRYGLQQGVFDKRAVKLLAAAAREAGTKAMLHIKVETGMNRLGVRIEELDELLDEADKHRDWVKVMGVFTHFATSDNADKTWVNEQNKDFLRAVSAVKARWSEARAHASCSGAIMDCPELRYDMVRAGIIAYGYYPSADVERKLNLESALSLKSVVSNVKTVEAGQAIGYSRTYLCDEPKRIATVPIGYGDGYRVAFSNCASVLVNGKRAAVTGRVCMDQMMVDVTNCGEVNVGDEVVLIGKQGEGEILADEAARWANTISYEIMLAISPRVRRVYLDE